MTAWLGICILVLFSLSLNWFMRGQNSNTLVLPRDLGAWVRCSEHDGAAMPEPGTYWERRTLVNEAAFWRRAHLVEQRRLRRDADGEILRVLPERRLAGRH